MYPIHEPEASNSLVYSRVFLSQFLYGNHTEFRNIISYAKTLGNGLTLKSSSYQRCMSKRYHYLLDKTKMQFVDYVNFFSLTATDCFFVLRKKTPNLKFSAIFFEFAFRSKIQDKFMFLISINFNKQHKTSYKILYFNLNENFYNYSE